jgi:hypothetical protein
MKIVSVNDENVFRPVTVTLTVENMDELRLLGAFLYLDYFRQGFDNDHDSGLGKLDAALEPISIFESTLKLKDVIDSDGVIVARDMGNEEENDAAQY